MSDAAAASSPEESIATASGAQDDTPDRPRRAKRTFLTQNACTRCRHKKSKCDGKRPRCGRCEKAGAECIYDVAYEGQTRMQSLQQRLEESEVNSRRLMTLFGVLQHGSDSEASTLFARLRLGEDIEELTAATERAAEAATRGMADEMDEAAQAPGAEATRAWPPNVPPRDAWALWNAGGQPGSGTMTQHDAAPAAGGEAFQTLGLLADGNIEAGLGPGGEAAYQAAGEYYGQHDMRYFGTSEWDTEPGGGHGGAAPN